MHLPYKELYISFLLIAAVSLFSNGYYYYYLLGALLFLQFKEFELYWDAVFF